MILGGVMLLTAVIAIGIRVTPAMKMISRVPVGRPPRYGFLRR
jgi:hypothetical protein